MKARSIPASIHSLSGLVVVPDRSILESRAARMPEEKTAAPDRRRARRPRLIERERERERERGWCDRRVDRGRHDGFGSAGLQPVPGQAGGDGAREILRGLRKGESSPFSRQPSGLPSAVCSDKTRVLTDTSSAAQVQDTGSQFWHSKSVKAQKKQEVSEFPRGRRTRATDLEAACEAGYRF